jgi:hypothetical protein
MKAYWGVGLYLHAFLTSALDGGEWSASRPSRFSPRKESLVPIGPQSWSGRSGEEKNSHPLPGLEPSIIQPVAQQIEILNNREEIAENTEIETNDVQESVSDVKYSFVGIYLLVLFVPTGA